MNMLDHHKRIDAVMATIAAHMPESEIEAHNQDIAHLRTLGYLVRWEPLYDEKGFSVAKRVGLFGTSAGDKPRLIDERWYGRGRLEGTPWTPITKASALRYRTRDGKIMAGW